MKEGEQDMDKVTLGICLMAVPLVGLVYVEATDFDKVGLEVPPNAGNYTHRYEIYGQQSGNSFYVREGYLDVTMKHWVLVDVLLQDDGDGSLHDINRTFVASGNKAHCQFPHWQQVGYNDHIMFTRGNIESFPMTL